MSTNKRIVSLHDTDNGLLLIEVVRAFLHTGTPSRMMSRIIIGIQHYSSEVENPSESKLRINENMMKIITDASERIRFMAGNEEWLKGRDI